MSFSWWGTCWTSVSTRSVSPRLLRWSSLKCWWRSSVTRYQRWSQASLTRSTSTRSDSLNNWDWSEIRKWKKLKEGLSSWPAPCRPVCPRLRLGWETWRSGRSIKRRRISPGGHHEPVRVVIASWSWGRPAEKDKRDKASRSIPRPPAPKTITVFSTEISHTFLRRR